MKWIQAGGNAKTEVVVAHKYALRIFVHNMHKIRTKCTCLEDDIQAVFDDFKS